MSICSPHLFPPSPANASHTHTHPRASAELFCLSKNCDERWHLREAVANLIGKRNYFIFGRMPRSLKSSSRWRCVFWMCGGWKVARVHANDTRYYYYLCVYTRISPRHMSNGFWHHRSTSPMEYELESARKKIKKTKEMTANRWHDANACLSCEIPNIFRVRS